MNNQELRLTPTQAFSKRLLDLVVSIVCLVLIAPLMLAIALLVKLDGPGPIIYKFRRFGSDGNEVNVYTFRTMRIDRVNMPILRKSTKDDPRITPFGAFLRRTSLDDLPLFFNVLRGEMSLVGPRPKPVAEYEYYKSLFRSTRSAKSIVHAKPGLTSLSRVVDLDIRYAKDEGTMKQLYELERTYIQHWSIWMDLKIIGKTVVRSLKGPG